MSKVSLKQKLINLERNYSELSNRFTSVCAQNESLSRKFNALQIGYDALQVSKESVFKENVRITDEINMLKRAYSDSLDKLKKELSDSQSRHAEVCSLYYGVRSIIIELIKK